jgi:hypothetical protein
MKWPFRTYLCYIVLEYLDLKHIPLQILQKNEYACEHMHTHDANTRKHARAHTKL